MTFERHAIQIIPMSAYGQNSEGQHMPHVNAAFYSQRAGSADVTIDLNKKGMLKRRPFRACHALGDFRNCMHNELGKLPSPRNDYCWQAVF